MRLSPSYYPERVDFTCEHCEVGHENIKVDSIEDDSVRVECPECGEPTYVKVVD